MAPRDQYPARGALGSAREFFAITPSDNDLPQIPRALWVGTGGTVVLDGVPHKNVPSGSRLDASPTKVNAATTAQDIVGWV